MTGSIFDLILRREVESVANALAGLPEPARRQLGVELVAFVRRLRDNSWSGREAAALAVAAVGCLPSAAKAAEVLGRRTVDVDMAAGPPVVATARQRGIDWLPDLARRLADRLSGTPPQSWGLVAYLFAEEKLPPPAGDRFVEGWLAEMSWPTEWARAAPLVDRLRADPFLDPLLPRLFEVDGLGGRLGFEDHRTRTPMALPHALVRLAAEGRIDRAVLLGGCVDRLVRGDRAAALRPFVVLHDLLAPTPAERAERSGDYLRLLADGPGPVASMAQKALRVDIDLELDELLDTSRAVLTRPEKGLVRTQLGWLDQLARQHPARAAEIVDVLGTAAGHPAVDLRDRAAALAAKHGTTSTSTSTSTSAPTSASASAGVVVRSGDDLPPVPAPPPLPPPITDPDELAEEVAGLLGTGLRALPLERVLDAVTRLTGTDQPRVTRALTPVLARHGAAEHRWSPSCLHGPVDDLLRAAAGPVRTSALRAWWANLLAAAHKSQLASDPRVAPAHRLLRVRIAEIGTYLGKSRGAGLLAAPTATNGALDPSVLYDRLAALGDQHPWRWDLTQALLRLPPGVDEDLAGRASALRTPGGDRLAAWLRSGGLPQPTFRTVTVRFRHVSSYHSRDYRMPTQRVQVEVGAAGSGAGSFDDPLGLLTGRVVRFDNHCASWSPLWPTVLPGYRGLVAAYALTAVASAADQDIRGGAEVLPLLAEATGTGGVAFDLALAYGLAARHPVDRVAAVDALLTLAAAGELDAASVGRQLGELAVGGTVTLARVVEPLRDLVLAGARLSAWRLLAAALPALLAASKPPRGTPDLLTLAAETATATGVPITVPGLTELAARRGSSRLLTEARRLATVLDHPAVPATG
ncbi:DUF6493 family protein [Plantactinospora endophytica]|uniref:Secreted protein n=1 Tax=Plantactinospora endophytica TaxID=673535 RepID=A0ABQ4E1X3_9ACTN|nr:DUF6493 family protein [Plantactinospora endophytica]GIG88717.1 hypothetical protein Pen02_36530 [Plantactinospora endophytica]